MRNHRCGGRGGAQVDRFRPTSAQHRRLLVQFRPNLGLHNGTIFTPERLLSNSVYCATECSTLQMQMPNIIFVQPTREPNLQCNRARLAKFDRLRIHLAESGKSSGNSGRSTAKFGRFRAPILSKLAEFGPVDFVPMLAKLGVACRIPGTRWPILGQVLVDFEPNLADPGPNPVELARSWPNISPKRHNIGQHWAHFERFRLDLDMLALSGRSMLFT